MVSVPSDKISYWSRTVIVPLLVLMAKKPRARNPPASRIDELFVDAARSARPGAEGAASERVAGSAFSAPSTVCCAPPSRSFLRRRAQRAIDSAVALVDERLNGEDGLGAIFPAMANSVMMYDALGYPERSSAARDRARVDRKLLVVNDDEAYCQPCVSPVWDTGLACHALLEAGGERAPRHGKQALDWLKPRRCSTSRATGSAQRPDVRPGGWAFQYANPHYPDLDDTAVVAMAMDRVARTCDERRLYERHRARPRMDRRPAEQQRRLGRVRCRQLTIISQQHSVRRSRRAARSADRGRDRALPVDAGAARRHARKASRDRARRSTICAARSSPTAAGTAAGA